MQRPGKLLLQEQIDVNHVIHDRLKNSIEQLKREDFRFNITLRIPSCRKESSELDKLWKFDKLISENKVTQITTNIRDKKKWAVNMCSTQLTHIENNIFAKKQKEP